MSGGTRGDVSSRLDLEASFPVRRAVSQGRGPAELGLVLHKPDLVFLDEATGLDLEYLPRTLALSGR